jgi:hypothetical protein
VPQGEGHGLQLGVHPQLGQDVLDVGLHGELADEQRLGHLLGGGTLGRLEPAQNGPDVPARQDHLPGGPPDHPYQLIGGQGLGDEPAGGDDHHLGEGGEFPDAPAFDPRAPAG